MWYMSLIPAAGRWRQEDHCTFESSLGWEVRACLKKPNQRGRGKGERRGEREEEREDQQTDE